MRASQAKLSSWQLDGLPGLIRKLNIFAQYKHPVLALPAGGIFFFHTLGDRPRSSRHSLCHAGSVIGWRRPKVALLCTLKVAECVAGMLAQLSERYDLRSAQLVGASSSALVATLSACGAGLAVAVADHRVKESRQFDAALSLKPVSLCLCSQ